MLGDFNYPDNDWHLWLGHNALTTKFLDTVSALGCHQYVKNFRAGAANVIFI